MRSSPIPSTDAERVLVVEDDAGTAWGSTLPYLTTACLARSPAWSSMPSSRLGHDGADLPPTFCLMRIAHGETRGVQVPWQLIRVIQRM